MLRPLLLALFLAPCAVAQGEIIVVDDTPDTADFAAPRTVAQLPGPDGRTTFREAVIAANNTPGPQTIHFNVPVERWWSLFDDRVTIFSNFDSFVITDDSLTVDGRSQTAFTGDTNPEGNEVAFWGQHPNSLGASMFYVTSDGNTFIGLDEMHRRGYGITLGPTAENNRIIGNTIRATLYAAVHVQGDHNTVGGTAPGEGNRLSSGNDGVRIESAFGAAAPTGNRIVGNYLTGSVSGVHVRDGAVGTVIGGPTPEERNVIADAGYFGGEGYPTGAQVAISNATDTVVEGNYIGLTEDGTQSSGQVGPTGIGVSASDGTLIRGNAIGGLRAEGRNHHDGTLFGWGIVVSGASDGTVVTGNRVGTSADGTAPVPNLNGILVSDGFQGGPPTHTTLGGPGPGAGNVVAYNERSGISIPPASPTPVTGVAISGNAVYENGGLGIDLALDGETANDPSDGDEGTNRLQNHPAIESAALDGPTLTVVYRVDTAPANATYPLRVEVFVADADGEEGAVFLGVDEYTASDHPGTREAVLDVSGSGLTAGALVLGTATDAEGNTSEFGATAEVTAVGVTVSAEPVARPVAIPADGGSFQFVLTLTNTSARPQTVRLWTEMDGPVSRSPVMAPRRVRVAGGGSVIRTMTQQVPASAPAGSYTYSAHVGTADGAAAASSHFGFVKEAGLARSADGTTDWATSGWDQATPTETSSLAEGFALSEARPNPSRRAARLTLDLARAQSVTATAVDALGRRVAVLHDGALEAGVHTLVFERGALSAGVYVVRVAGEDFAATRRVTLGR